MLLDPAALRARMQQQDAVISDLQHQMSQMTADHDGDVAWREKVFKLEALRRQEEFVSLQGEAKALQQEQQTLTVDKANALAYVAQLQAQLAAHDVGIKNYIHVSIGPGVCTAGATVGAGGRRRALDLEKVCLQGGRGRSTCRVAEEGVGAGWQSEVWVKGGQGRCGCRLAEGGVAAG